MEPKILIISEQRSGTNLITRLLAEHPDLTIWGEPFCHPHQFGMNKKWKLDRLIKRIWENSNGGAIHRTESIPHNWNGLWPKLANMKDLKVIDIKRMNLLRRFLSLRVAEKTKKWIDPIDRPLITSLPTISIDADNLETNFIRMNRLYRQRDHLFTPRNPLYLTYEEFVEDIPGTVEMILDFLELPQIELAPQTSKRETRSLREAITNYDELKHQFRHTNFAHFFED